MSISLPSTAEFRSKNQTHRDSLLSSGQNAAAAAKAQPTEFASFRHILESFSIPFVVIASDGHEVFRSADADRIEDAILVWTQARHLASCLILESLPRQRTSLGITSPSIHGATLHARLATLDDETVAVVAVRSTLATTSHNSAFLKLGLTPRETEVARLMAQGKSVKQVAGGLTISIHTARRHAERIYQKLGIQTRSQLVLIVERTMHGNHSMVEG